MYAKSLGGNEDCDDGDDDNTDECPDTCIAAYCGDGFKWAGNEECDDGDTDDTDGCTIKCKNATCGDGILRVDGGSE